VYRSKIIEAEIECLRQPIRFEGELNANAWSGAVADDAIVDVAPLNQQSSRVINFRAFKSPPFHSRRILVSQSNAMPIRRSFRHTMRQGI
jgi:hypothetical protein